MFRKQKDSGAELRAKIEQEFVPDPRLEALVEQFREIQIVGVGISLDGDCFSEERRQQEYYIPRAAFIREHGAEVLDYLRPYREAADSLTGKESLSPRLNVYLGLSRAIESEEPKSQ